MTGNGAAGTRFSATGAAGPCTVQLRQARITGELSLERATVVSYPVQGQSGGAGPGTGDGAVCLSGATIGGDLVLAGATLTSAAGPALLADQVTIAGDAFRCDHSGADFRATGTGDLGAVYLAGAHVGGQLCLRAAALTSKNGPALEADAVTVDGDVLLDLGFTATGAGPRATLGLRAAAIGGRLSLDAGTVTSGRLPEEAGPPGELPGAVHLTGATVGGDLLARGATLTAFAGPALRADHLTVNGDAFGCQRRNEGFRATGTGSDGAVVLAAATVGGQLSLSGAVITNDSGPALVADTAMVQGGGRLGRGVHRDRRRRRASGRQPGGGACGRTAQLHRPGGRRAAGYAGARPRPGPGRRPAAEHQLRGHAERRRADLRRGPGAALREPAVPGARGQAGRRVAPADSPRAPAPGLAARSPGSARPCTWRGRITIRQRTRCLSPPRPAPPPPGPSPGRNGGAVVAC